MRLIKSEFKQSGIKTLIREHMGLPMHAVLELRELTTVPNTFMVIVDGIRIHGYRVRYSNIHAKRWRFEQV